MALSKEERSMSFVVKDPRFPMAVVEGKFKGERAVFLCLMDRSDDKDPDKGWDLTPFAMLLDPDRGDLKHVTGADGESLGQPDPADQLVLPPGMKGN